MRNRIFHQARIAGLTFDGIIAGDEPYLSCQINGGVALGVCTLRYFQPEAWGSRLIPPLGLVVKYHNEERIFLAGFDAEAIRELSNEFGLPVLTEFGFDPCDSTRLDYFFPPPACDARPPLATRIGHWPEGRKRTRAVRGASALPRWLLGRHFLHVGGLQRLAADSPIAALHLTDLHLTLLFGREHALNHVNFDEWH